MFADVAFDWTMWAQLCLDNTLDEEELGPQSRILMVSIDDNKAGGVPALARPSVVTRKVALPGCNQQIAGQHCTACSRAKLKALCWLLVQQPQAVQTVGAKPSKPLNSENMQWSY